MHNIPKYYTTKGLINGKVLKFDIRRPTKDEQLRNKQTERTNNHTQECIIEPHNEITNNGQIKGQIDEQTNMNRKNDEKRENNQGKIQTAEKEKRILNKQK